GHTLTLAHQAKEQVLGADVVVVEPLRLVLSQGQDLARAIRELVEAIHRVERLFPSRAPRTCRSGHASTTVLPVRRVGRTVRPPVPTSTRRRRMHGGPLRNRNDPPGGPAGRRRRRRAGQPSVFASIVLRAMSSMASAASSSSAASSATTVSTTVSIVSSTASS